MARKLVTHIDIWSDLDGTPLPGDSKPVEFSFDGRVYFIDLSDVQQKEMQEFLQPYMDSAHKNLKVSSLYRPRKPHAPAELTTTEDKPKAYSRVAPGEDGPTQQMLRDRRARMTIKEWANGNGWEVGARGMIPSDAVLAYREKHPRAYIPESTLEMALRVAGQDG